MMLIGQGLQLQRTAAQLLPQLPPEYIGASALQLSNSAAGIAGRTTFPPVPPLPPEPPAPLLPARAPLPPLPLSATVASGPP